MKVILYMAISLDGFIAREDDETPWSEEENNSWVEFVMQKGNLILGRRTYDLMKEANEFEKLENPFTVVVSNRVRVPDNQTTIFVRSPEEALTVLKKRKIEEAVLGGGGTINASFLKEGLIDEVLVDIEPIILGSGIKLFGDEEFATKLKLLEVKNISGNTVQARYGVVKK